MIIPLILFTPITSDALVQWEQRLGSLDESDRAYVEAAPSSKRRALRVAQLDLARAGARRFGVDDTTITLISDEQGRPQFSPSPDPPLYLSASHTKDVLVVAIARHQIGIDIEKLRTMPQKPITLLFSPTEQEDIIDDESFTRAWVRKEAYAKWLGSGLVETLADGVYRTETAVHTLTIEGQLLYLGLAGASTDAESIRENRDPGEWLLGTW
ncbi:MAG: 4'-phosphopantetheinyl transferase superfamily protein [Actinomycetia bacterium]|nr:4'-phosphopantetheinyl transferase superfamily protein [Actinomycetes bacterium]